LAHLVWAKKEFAVSPKDIEVVFGRENINKQLRIHAPNHLPAVISQHLSQEAEKAQ